MEHAVGRTIGGASCLRATIGGVVFFSTPYLSKKQKNPNKDEISVLEAMVTRSLFGNINASRNSA